MAVADLVSWEIVGTKPEKPKAKKQMGNPKKAWNAGGTAGVATVELAAGSKRGRRCRFFCSLGCDTSHPEFTCKLLKRLKPEFKKRPSRTAGCGCSV